MVRAVSVYGNLPRALVCPMGAFCGQRCGANDKRWEYSTCGSWSRGLGSDRMAEGHCF